MNNTDLRHHCYAMGYSDGEVGAFYDGHEKGMEDAIEKCAEIISKNMRCESCPVDCLWGTEEKCKDALALYLKTQIEEQKNE